MNLVANPNLKPKAIRQNVSGGIKWLLEFSALTTIVFLIIEGLKSPYSQLNIFVIFSSFIVVVWLMFLNDIRLNSFYNSIKVVGGLSISMYLNSTLPYFAYKLDIENNIIAPKAWHFVSQYSEVLFKIIILLFMVDIIILLIDATKIKKTSENGAVHD